MATIIGWDIGGAHVKAARVVGDRVVEAIQEPCQIWLGTAPLASVIGGILTRLGACDLHVATMTGELADIFPSRAAGVAELSALLARVLDAPLIYAGDIGFVAAEWAGLHTAAVASANWHATAALAATHLPCGLLADIGSTTTDLVPFAGGRVLAAGYGDAERMVAGELAYTGFTRGFLMAVAGRAPFAGKWTTLANEHFATTADVYRILGELDEAADQMPTADNREKTPEASQARLARLIGRDAGDGSDAAWRDLAAWFAEMQMRQIEDGARLVLSRGELPDDAPVLGAGVGILLARRLAARLRRGFVSFADVCAADAPAEWVVGCAPAAAVALLAARRRVFAPDSPG